uniref:Galectin n=1 Tax=Caenorhabditis tropicalis TaxID=1561998 RepID=A0A1I7UXJ1_9PELO
MLIIIIILYFLFSTSHGHSEHGPLLKVRGFLYCYGIPFKGKLTLINYENLHLYSVYEANSDGYFRLAGDMNDDPKDLKLIIEHSCVDWKNGRFGEGPDMFSEHSFLGYSDVEMHLEIELSEHYVVRSFPELYLLKLLSFGRRMATDNQHRIKKSDFWKHFLHFLFRFRKSHLRR